MDIYAVKIPNGVMIPEFELLLAMVGPEKQARIRRFYRHGDAQRALVAEIMIRALICETLGYANSKIHFAVTEYGKPFLVGAPDFHFNLSHADEWITCVIDVRQTGIDVEKIQTIDFAIAERFFSREECQDLFQQEEAVRLSYFFDLWTLKESYIKTDGRGLFIPLHSFSIRVFPEKIIMKTDNPMKDCYFKQYDLDPAYKFSVCGLTPEFPESIRVRELGFFSEKLEIL